MDASIHPSVHSSIYSFTPVKKVLFRLPGGLTPKTPCSRAGDLGLISSQGARSRMLQWRLSVVKLIKRTKREKKKRKHCYFYLTDKNLKVREVVIVPKVIHLIRRSTGFTISRKWGSLLSYCLQGLTVIILGFAAHMFLSQLLNSAMTWKQPKTVGKWMHWLFQ